MTKNLTVRVTQPLIDRATQRDSRHCMIAEAIRAAHPDYRGVMVDLQTIRWSNPRTRKRYIALTPEVAARRLVQFDQGEAMEPFAFELSAVQITAMSKPKETPEEAAADGRPRARVRQPSRKKTLVGSNGREVIHGGRPLIAGHLSSAGDRVKSVPEPLPSVGDGGLQPTVPVEVPEGSSNVVRSGRRYRQYGRRLLQG